MLERSNTSFLVITPTILTLQVAVPTPHSNTYITVPTAVSCSVRRTVTCKCPTGVRHVCGICGQGCAIQRDPAQSRRLEVIQRADYASAVLPEAPRRSIRVWGRRRGLVCALSGTHSPRECVRWLWNDQTGGTTRFPTCIERIDRADGL